MAGYKYYCAFDLGNGYHNLVLSEDAQPKTAIVLPDDLGLPARIFEFSRLSFGLSSAPGIFQSVTDRLVIPAQKKTPENDLGEAVAVYLDDLILAGMTIPDCSRN